VQALARGIAAAGRGEHAHVFRLGGWSERMLDWALTHSDFKTQLFRLVDVFPACTNDADVLRHVDEYFEGIPVPHALDLGVELAEHVPFGAQVTAAVVRRNVRRMARQFIAGETPGAAVPRLTRLWRRGEASTVDLLGEHTVTETEADHYARRVRELLDTLVTATAAWPAQPHLEHDPWGALPRADVSVKPSALSPLFRPLTADEGIAAASARLEPVVERARNAGATVHLDTEHDDTKDLAFTLLRELGARFPDVQLGCVVQAYRRDAHADLQDLIEWSRAELRTPLRIRLVKGAYWDAETLLSRAEGWPSSVYGAKAETDASFERCVRTMVDVAGVIRPAFATHNVRSLAYGIIAARTHGLDDTAIELQLLYGMAEPVHAALTAMGARVRVYAPVGELVPGMAYLVRRLLENTSNESFVRRRFAEGADLDDLVQPPAVTVDALPAPPVPRPPTDASAPAPFSNEPVAELRRPGPRARLDAAVQHAARDFGFHASVRVAGATRAGRGELASVDPSDPSTVVCISALATPADVDEAIAVARRGLDAWRATPWRERAAVIIRAAAIMRRDRDALAALVVHEAGKPVPEADADVCEAIDFCEYYARAALALAAGAPVHQVPGEVNLYRYEPRGIGAVIAPWNFPLAIPTGMVSAALVTGNAVLFKPAEQTPGIGARLVEMLLEAGAPPEMLAFLPGIGEEVGAALVAHPDVSFITFTGSKAVGLDIVRQAARHREGQRQVKRVVAEMGGKNAIVVDTDADLDVAVPAIVHSAFSHAGQKCSAASRLIGVGERFDQLVERVVGAARVVPIGPAREPRTVVGPLIDEAALTRVRAAQADAPQQGDVLLLRDDLPSVGWFAGPTVVVTDRPDCALATEEIFGPVLTCLRAEDFDHAVALANATDYALTGGVFSRSPSRIRHAIDELRVGNLYVNRAITGARVGRHPFGGLGLSGVGSKAGGPDYLQQFTEPRVVSENVVRQGFAPLQE
jgi:RHH-type proline utilization regulon transcriptional repressor/proline dehydrogenase/delta 1-pyrroline-5-carboxylate dehydrogenase